MRSCSWCRDVDRRWRLDKVPAGLCDSWALIERQIRQGSFCAAITDCLAL
jgi:hypothetical protein